MRIEEEEKRSIRGRWVGGQLCTYTTRWEVPMGGTNAVALCVHRTDANTLMIVVDVCDRDHTWFGFLLMLTLCDSLTSNTTKFQ
jgi:hypothetical protein